MSIIWCGGEEIDWEVRSGCSMTATPGYYRSDYSRGAITAAISGYYWHRLPQEYTTLWYTHRAYNTFRDANMNTVVFGQGEPSIANSVLGLDLGGTGGKMRLFTYDGAPKSVLQTSGYTYTVSSIVKIDIKISNYGASGRVQVWLDSVLHIDYSGDITDGGATALDFVGGYSLTSLPSSYVSEVIVADESTFGMSLRTLAPNAAGDNNDWTGAYTDIGEFVLSDADVISTSNPGDDFQCNLLGMPPGNFSIKGVRVAARGSDSAQQLAAKVGIRTNSTNYLGGARSLLAAWQTFAEIWTVNPDTSSPFTGSEIDALQLAISTVTATTTTSTTTSTTTTT